MVFARWVFLIAGVWGLLVIPPLYFLESRIGLDDPPAITHPEYYYGFTGVGLAWQLAFLIIASNPVRYRPLMVPSILEKTTFAAATSVLCCQQRVSGQMFGLAIIDLMLGVLFAVAFWRTR